MILDSSDPHAGVSHRGPLAPDLPSLEAALLAFVAWLRRTGYDSYDQYDLWATAYGIRARRLYYRWGRPATPLVLPLALIDWLVPASRRWFCPRRRYPIADAHYLMGFVALHQALGNGTYLAAAAQLADSLMASSIPGFSGPCWGYPFDWQARDGLCRRDTPLITTTPYVFDAFLDLYRVTGQERYLESARAIAGFVAHDIPDTPAGRGSAAGYTPFDHSKVINASAYRAACLAQASRLFGEARYRQIARRNALFVVDQQRADGSWPYAADDPRQAFVDHMHTCFVLKGLYRTYQVLRDDEILEAVKRGYRYYRQDLFYPGGLPRPFAFARTETSQFRMAELYDYAEALNLALLLQPDLRTAALADRLAFKLLAEWQTPAGYFVTRISRGEVRNCVPYHRWAQAQTFRSLALYYLRARMGR